MAPGRLGIIEVGVEQHVRRAHGLELPEVAAHLLDAALARAARVFRHRPVRELQLDPRAERGHRPVLLLGDLLEPGQPCIPQPVHAHPDRVPGVAMKHRAPERTLAGPANPDGRVGRAERPGRRVDALEADEAPLVARHVLGPAGLDGAQIVIGHGPTLVEGEPQRLELLLRPSHADPEDESPARELVDHGGGARRLERMTIGDDDDRGAQLHPLGHPREPAEHGQGLVEGRGIAALDVGRDGHVVRGHEQVIAQLLDEASPREQSLRRRAGAEVDEVDADLHGMACARPATTVRLGRRFSASGAILIFDDRLPPPRMT